MYNIKMNEKYLIIPDLHLRHDIAEKIIKQENPNLTIFLGDVFDDFNDTPDMIRETSEWFQWSINQKNRIFCCGNHDVHYWFKDNKKLRCSGYDQFKSIIINDIVTAQDWEKLVFFYVIDNKWLLSHAGVHPFWIGLNSKEKRKESQSLIKITEKLSEDSIYAKINFSHNNAHWFSMPGFTRSNSSNYGGILWLDFDGEFVPIKGIHQICGHTPNLEPTWKVMENDGNLKQYSWDEIKNPVLTDSNSYNICLDSRPGSNYYAIYENGNLTIHPILKNS